MYYSNKKNGCGHYKSNDIYIGAIMKDAAKQDGCACCLYFSLHNCQFSAAKLLG